MDHVRKFEHNVMTRIHDVRSVNNGDSPQLDIRPSYLFLGVTIGIIISRISVFTKKQRSYLKNEKQHI